MIIIITSIKEDLIILILSLIMRSSISLMSLRRVVLSTWNKWQRSKKWDVVSGSNLHSHRGLRKSRKLSLNLCLFKWLKPNRSLVNSCNPMGLWIPNVSTCFGRMKLDKAFLKAVYDVMLLILMSSLLHSVMTLGKKEFLKYSVLHLKDGIFVLFLGHNYMELDYKCILVILSCKFYGRDTIFASIVCL